MLALYPTFNIHPISASLLSLGWRCYLATIICVAIMWWHLNCLVAQLYAILIWSLSNIWAPISWVCLLPSLMRGLTYMRPYIWSTHLIGWLSDKIIIARPDAWQIASANYCGPRCLLPSNRPGPPLMWPHIAWTMNSLHREIIHAEMGSTQA